MKDSGIWLFLGCVVISIGIYRSSVEIAGRIPSQPSIPSTVTLVENTDNEYGEFLSVIEAAEFLKIEYKRVEALIKSGEFESCCFEIDGMYVIVRDKLIEWANDKLN